MKRWIAFLLVMGVCLAGHSQNSSIQAMIKQIALLQTYIGYLEKGYDIARKGLNTISDIKNGHWKLDIDFFNSLKAINPKIKNYSKVLAVLQMQADIIHNCRNLRRLPVNAGEVEYIANVIDFLEAETQVTVGLLEQVIADKALTMSDDKRIDIIDDIYDDVSDKYQFISSFLKETKSLLVLRTKEQNDINVLKTLNNPIR